MQPRISPAHSFVLCRLSCLLGLAVLGPLRVWGEDSPVPRAAIEKSVQRAVSYLSPEVAKWKDEHKCYSCHNHGDGARALFAAKKLGIAAGADAIQITTDWLQQTDQWDHNGPDGPFSDRKLARIQFAAALAEAKSQGFISKPQSLRAAAKQLASEQLPAGAWDFEGADSVGGPTTYGRVLASVLARRVLRLTDPKQFQDPIARCDQWLRKFETRSVMDAAAVLIGLENATDERAVLQRRKCREILESGQAENGGWGPYVTASPEAFDTALVVLALSLQDDDRAKAAKVRGARYLIRTQLSDGSWSETTRPAPRESYSQRISTTAWAVLALVEVSS